MQVLCKKVCCPSKKEYDQTQEKLQRTDANILGKIDEHERIMMTYSKS